MRRSAEPEFKVRHLKFPAKGVIVFLVNYNINFLPLSYQIFNELINWERQHILLNYKPMVAAQAVKYWLKDLRTSLKDLSLVRIAKCLSVLKP